MKPTFKTLLVTLLLFFITTSIMAQEKYEHATVFAINMGNKTDGIYTTYSNKPQEKIDVKWNRSLLVQDYSEILKYIETMTDQGWELVTVDDGKYFLKRKKN